MIKQMDVQTLKRYRWFRIPAVEAAITFYIKWPFLFCIRIEILKELVQDKFSRNFKRPKNGEDGSDFDDFLTKRIAALSAIF